MCARKLTEQEGRELTGKKARRLSDTDNSTEERTMFDDILSVDEFSKLDLPEQKLILEPWLPELSISLVSGTAGTGKTWFALSLAVAVASKGSLGPWKVINPVKTLYLDGEMPGKLLQKRLNLLGVQDRKFRKPILTYSDSYMSRRGWPRANLTSKDWRNDMKDYLIRKKIKFFILDNLSSLTSGLDENSKQEYAPINSWLLDLRFAGITTMILHHTNKEGSQRGTSSREDNIDTSILLNRPPYYRPSQGAYFKVNFTKSRLMSGDLHQLEDLRFKFEEKDGRVDCTYRFARDDNRASILRLLDAGKKPKEIAEELGVSASTISQRKREAIDKGWMKKDCQFTEKGAERFIENEKS